MAAETLSPHLHPLTSLSPPSPAKFNNTYNINININGDFAHHKSCTGRARNQTRRRSLALRVSLHDHVLSSAALVERLHPHHHGPSSLILLAESMGYSLASYYTSLGLFVISVPGLWSLIKRSVKSKVLSYLFLHPPLLFRFLL